MTKQDSTGIKILAYDLECAPSVVHSWGLWNQTHSINQIMADPYIMSFAARWVGVKGKPIFTSVYHDGREKMLQTLHGLFDQADALMGYNSIGFDTKWANGEFIREGMLPPSPSKEIDLMRVVKSNARFISNKLDYVAQALGIGKKESTGGHELWVACMAGDPKAWAKMRKYNIQDVDLLIDLYEKLKPWIKNHPQMAFYGGHENGCPTCGSENIQKRGFKATNVSTFQQYQCRACGKWFQSGKALQRAEMRP